MKEGFLRVLAVSSDPDIGRALAHVIAEEGDVLDRVATVDEAVALATAERIDVAFVDLSADEGGALVLCHHLPTVCVGISVHVIVKPRDLDAGAEAMSLGAAGVIVAPPTGDAIARILTEKKAEISRSKQVGVLEKALAWERRRLETYDRLVRFARGATPSDAVRAIVDGVAQITGSEGVALYATFGKDESERVLLAALGTALDLPSAANAADLARLLETRQSRVIPLVAASGELGFLVLDHAPSAPEAEIVQLASLAAAMLALVDKKDSVEEGERIFPPRQFGAIADRILTLALRHDRRASILAVRLPLGESPTKREETTSEIADIIRATDALCETQEGDLLVLLPETGGIGAHVCRRRILARLAGDRRARPKGASSRSQGETKTKASPVAIGVATFPHDGTNFKRLVKAARARSLDDGRSAVHAFALDTMLLPEVVDALLLRPMFDAGPRSPYPLDVACSALFSLVTRACREGLRGGPANVLSTLQPGLGMAAAARQVTTPRVLDVRGEAGCEDLEAIVVEAEHGAWVCCGRLVGDRFRGVHAADPLLADVISRHLSAVGGSRAG